MGRGKGGERVVQVGEEGGAVVRLGVAEGAEGGDCWEGWHGRDGRGVVVQFGRVVVAWGEGACACARGCACACFGGGGARLVGVLLAGGEGRVMVLGAGGPVSLFALVSCDASVLGRDVMLSPVKLGRVIHPIPLGLLVSFGLEVSKVVVLGAGGLGFLLALLFGRVSVPRRGIMLSVIGPSLAIPLALPGVLVLFVLQLGKAVVLGARELDFLPVFVFHGISVFKRSVVVSIVVPRSDISLMLVGVLLMSSLVVFSPAIPLILGVLVSVLHKDLSMAHVVLFRRLLLALKMPLAVRCLVELEVVKSVLAWGEGAIRPARIVLTLVMALVLSPGRTSVPLGSVVTGRERVVGVVDPALAVVSAVICVDDPFREVGSAGRSMGGNFPQEECRAGALVFCCAMGARRGSWVVGEGAVGLRTRPSCVALVPGTMLVVCRGGAGYPGGIHSVGGRRGRTSQGAGAWLLPATEVDREESLLDLPRRANHDDGLPTTVLPPPQRPLLLLHAGPQPRSLGLHPVRLQADILGHRLGKERRLVEVDLFGAGLGPSEGDAEPLLVAGPDMGMGMQQRGLVLLVALIGPFAFVPTLFTLAALTGWPGIG